VKKNKSKSSKKKTLTTKTDLALEVTTAISSSVVATSRTNQEVVPSVIKTTMMRIDLILKVETDNLVIKDAVETIVVTTTAVAIKEEKPTLTHGPTSTSTLKDLDMSVLRSLRTPKSLRSQPRQTELSYQTRKHLIRKWRHWKIKSRKREKPFAKLSSKRMKLLRVARSATLQ